MSYTTAESMCTIPKFEKLASYSPEYYTTIKIVVPKSKKCCFNLLVYPCGFNKRLKDYISIWIKKKSSEELMVRFTCAVVNVEDREIFRKSKKQKLALESILGWSTFCPRRLVLNPENNVLKNGKLSLMCKIDIFEHVTEDDLDDDVLALSFLSRMPGDFRHMPQDASHSDLILRAGLKTFPVHKAILCARSPVFKDVLSQQNELKEILVEDMTTEGMKAFLEFIYTGELGNIDFSIALEMYCIAHKYGVLSLKCFCSGILENKLNIDSVIQVLLSAHKNSDLLLLESCLGFMDENMRTMKERPDWIQLMKNFPELANKALFFHDLKRSVPYNETRAVDPSWDWRIWNQIKARSG